jgi:hypothetical protein
MNNNYPAQVFNSQVQNIYPAKYNLTLKSEDFNKWKDRWESMIWEPKDEYSHLSFEDSNESEVADRGKFFELNDLDLDSPFKASEKDIEEANIWVLPGSLSTTRYDMSLTLHDIKTFFCENNCNTLHEKALIFCPYSSGKLRYFEAIEYNANPQEYYSHKIEKFVRKYFLPRLIREKKLAFIAYDIGCKEMAMIENATRHILSNEYKYSNEIVEKLFRTVTAVCVGDANDINNLPDLRFKKVVLLSASDQGLFIPKSLYYKIYNAVVCNRPFTAFKVDKHETLIFLGHQSSVELLEGRLNHDGHKLPHYLKAMNQNLPITIFNYLHSLIFKNNAQDELFDYELEQMLTEI